MPTKVYENPVIGDKAIILKTSEETNGEFSLLEVEVAVGGGNTLHYHKDYLEKFEVIEGELTVHKGKEQKVLQAGESFTVFPKQLHCFSNKSNKIVRFRVELRPGQTGFENSIKIAYGLAKDGLTDKNSAPKNFWQLALLVTMSNTFLPGIYSILQPLFKWGALRARKKGIEKELFDKYCN